MKKDNLVDLVSYQNFIEVSFFPNQTTVFFLKKNKVEPLYRR